MPEKDMPSKTGDRTYDSCKLEDFIVPELEDLQPGWRPWTAKEDKVLVKYYNKVPGAKLKQYLDKTFPPGRTLDSIYKRAKRLGLTREKT